MSIIMDNDKLITYKRANCMFIKEESGQQPDPVYRQVEFILKVKATSLFSDVDISSNDTQGDTQELILNLIRDNNKISIENIASALQISRSSAARTISQMKNLKFIGKGYSGHWEICDIPQENTFDAIFKLINDNNKISIDKIASSLNISRRTVTRAIAKMSNIKFVGKGYSGHWEVCETSTDNAGKALKDE